MSHDKSHSTASRPGPTHDESCCGGKKKPCGCHDHDRSRDCVRNGSSHSVRTRFYQGMLLDADDMTTSADAERCARQRIAALMMGRGVVCGLRMKVGPSKECPGDPNRHDVYISHGIALDGQGRWIQVLDDVQLPLDDLCDPCSRESGRGASSSRAGGAAQDVKWVCVRLRYREQLAAPKPVHDTDSCEDVDACEPSRIREGWCIDVVPAESCQPCDCRDPLGQVEGQNVQARLLLDFCDDEPDCSHECGEGVILGAIPVVCVGVKAKLNPPAEKDRPLFYRDGIDLAYRCLAWSAARLNRLARALCVRPKSRQKVTAGMGRVIRHMAVERAERVMQPVREKVDAVREADVPETIRGEWAKAKEEVVKASESVVAAQASAEVPEVKEKALASARVRWFAAWTRVVGLAVDARMPREVQEQLGGPDMLSVVREKLAQDEKEHAEAREEVERR